MVAKQEPRRLEVVVLAARGLPTAQELGAGISLGEGRRKVQITLVGPRDPEGEAFGAKVSPWTELSDDGRSLRFGRTGLRCTFPLETGQGAPSAVADPRFAELTRLRVRLLSSMVPSHTSALRKVTDLLPTSFAEFAGGVSRELDEATAIVEAQAQIPLANIISGRVGFAADRALGGWVPLTRTEETAPSAGFEEGPPLSVWMQMFALPDHEGWLTQLQKQLEEEIRRQPLPATLPGGASQAAAADAAAKRGGLVPNQGYATSGAVGQRRLSELAAAGGAAPRWGPANRGAEAAAASASAMPDLLDVGAPDLIDVSLDDEPQPLPQTQASAGSAFAFVGTGGPAASTSTTSAMGGAVGDLLSLDEGALGFGAPAAPGASASPPFPFAGAGAGASDGDLLGAALPRLGEGFGGGVASAAPAAEVQASPSIFGFVSGSAASSVAAVAPSAAAVDGGGASAFGFIAAGSPGSQLDLASLYSNAGDAPRPSPLNPVTPARYDYLLDMGRGGGNLGGPSAALSGGGAGAQLAPGAGAGAGGKGGAQEKGKPGLASWEQNLMAGLSESLRT